MCRWSFFFAVIFSVAFANAEPLAYIYRGRGACNTCPESIATILQSMGLKTSYISPGHLKKKALRKAILYVQPGGSDRIEDTLEALSKKEVSVLKNFVAEGGHYLGICAGAYLAGQWSDVDHRTRAFGFVDTVIQEEMPSSEPQLANVLWLGTRYPMYVQSAPGFDLKDFPNAQSWATYEGSGHSAALFFPFKKGKVGLIGPHLEAPESWYAEEDLSVEKGHLATYAQFARDFIQTLIKTDKN